LILLALVTGFITLLVKSQSPHQLDNYSSDVM
jgi:hypothetical protein